MQHIAPNTRIDGYLPPLPEALRAPAYESTPRVPLHEVNPLNTTFSARMLSPEQQTNAEPEHHPHRPAFLKPLTKIGWAKLNFAMNVIVCGCSIAAIVLHSWSGNYGAVAAMIGATFMNTVVGYSNLQRIYGADI